MKTRILFIAFILGFFSIKSQDIPIGQWRTHLPFNQAIALQEVGNEIYCLTTSSLFIYDKPTGNIETISKLDGLSGNSFSAISYNKSWNCVVIGYEDGTIDLIKDSHIVNVPDIRMSSVIGTKKINRIFCHNKYAYLCCNFGVVVYDIEREEVKETYKIVVDGVEAIVWDFTADDRSFYAATENGIYTILQNDPQITFYKSWKLMKTPDTTGSCVAINYWKEKLVYYYEKSYKVYSQTPGKDDATLLMSWVYNPTSQQKLSITISNDQLSITSYQNFFVFSDSYQSYKTINTLNVNGEEKQIYPTQSLYAGNNQYYVADYYLGMLSIKDINLAATESIVPNGPYSYKAYNMATDGTKIWVASGGHVNSWAPSWNFDGLFCFDGYTWKSFNRNNKKLPEEVHDITNVTIHPRNKNLIYVGTWGSGVVEITDDVVTNIYDASNSPLQTRIEDETQGVFIAGIVFDSKGVMWIANSNVLNQLISRDASGKWESYYLGNRYSRLEIRSLIIDQYDNKWMVTRDGKIIVYNEESTAKVRGIDALSGLESLAYSLAEDKNGDIWVGTNSGIYIIRNTYNILTLNNGALSVVNIDRPKLSIGETVSYLLKNETIVHITVNGANEKWCSSSKQGLYKLSEDGLTEIFHLTDQNSPLFSISTTATCIADNGEVFMATERGIVSYRDEATKGNKSNSNVYAFPNPVKPDYQGPIAISGVVDMADIKITDVAGNLVYSTQAKGGQAIWNVQDFTGKRVKTGVYIVYITNENGSETTITKVMVLN